jgi:predicted secreted Zn-dependent protease
MTLLKRSPALSLSGASRFAAARRKALRAALLAALATLALLPAPALARDWQPSERIETYAVTGATGIDLYRSIGDRAPSAGVGQAIAFTDFELLWSRDYRPQPDGSCILASARPSLTIIYRWPVAPSGLAPDVAASWARFIAGVEKHERVHGDHVIEMTEKIQAFSTGLSAPADADCNKVRAKLQEFLAGMAAERLARARAFDRDEMGNGGNVHQLILALVNGP